MFGTSALDAVANVKDHHAIAPVRQVGEPIEHLNVVKVAADHGESAAGFLRNRNAHLRGTLYLPTRHFLGIFHVGEIDNAKRAGGIVGEIHVVSVDVGAVHAAGYRGAVFGNNFGMHRVGRVQKNDTVFAAGSTFAGDDADFAVGGNADIVDQAGIDS